MTKTRHSSKNQHTSKSAILWLSKWILYVKNTIQIFPYFRLRILVFRNTFFVNFNFWNILISKIMHIFLTNCHSSYSQNTMTSFTLGPRLMRNHLVQNSTTYVVRHLKKIPKLVPKIALCKQPDRPGVYTFIFCQKILLCRTHLL